MKVRDIMTRKVISVTPQTSISQVAALLFDKDLTGMPVIDKNQRVVGIVTEYDLMSHERHIHIPSYIEFLKTFSDPRHEKDKKVKQDIDTILATKVENIMTKKVVTVKPDDTLTMVADIFVTQRINPLPVVDEQGGLVGIVSRADIVKLFKRKRR